MIVHCMQSEKYKMEADLVRKEVLNMAADMKEKILEASRKLLFEQKKRKLTVTDIVEECQITRQAFYYHFEDIPDMLKWGLERDADKIWQQCIAQGNPEDALRYFFLIAINLRPYLVQGMKTNYSDALERILMDELHKIVKQVAEYLELYQQYPHEDVDLMIRYHSHAVVGLLLEWTDEDTKNIDYIVHMVCKTLFGNLGK